jgi:phage baseplate assembly protein W
MEQNRIYTGFSTKGRVRAPYTLTDAELIKTDIVNELLTRKGERVMRPNYGTTIHDMIMNPLDDFVVAEVEEEIRRIVSKDPRVELGDVFISVLEHTIRADVQLTILPFLDPDSLYVEYSQEELEV